MSLRYLLLMRHAKHERGRVNGKPTGPAPLDKIASSVRELAQSSSTVWRSGSGIADFSNASPDAVLTDQGRYETLVAAKRLKEFLPEWTPPSIDSKAAPTVTLGGVIHYDHHVETEAKETAATFCEGFKSCPQHTPSKSKLLGPLTQPKALKKRNKRKRESSLERGVKNKARSLVADKTENAVLFIGHQPAVGWLASALLDRPVPIVQSEILCIDLEAKGGPALRWCISPPDETVLQALQDKIKSKMGLANLLSGFITAGLGVFLGMLADDKKMKVLGEQRPVVFIAAACLFLAVVLYLRTMFSYDTLLMPVRFWADSSSGTSHRPPWIVARPPSGAHWILYQNMLRIWQWQFIPATFLTLSGLFLVLGSVTVGALTNAQQPNRPISPVIIVSVPVVILLLILALKIKDMVRGVRRGWRNFWACGLVPKLRYLCGPWLGSED